MAPEIALKRAEFQTKEDAMSTPKTTSVVYLRETLSKTSRGGKEEKKSFETFYLNLTNTT